MVAFTLVVALSLTPREESLNTSHGDCLGERSPDDCLPFARGIP